MLERLLRDAIHGHAAGDGPGAVIGLTARGEVVSEARGIANLEQPTPLTDASVFHLASLSKQFTAAIIAWLVSQKTLSLDDDVRTFVPELPSYQRPIRMRHLLYHTSGIRDYPALMKLGGRGEYDLWTEDEVVTLLANQRALNFPSGQSHLYSNSGYFLLALIARRLSGTSLPDLSREALFEPLGMHDTFFSEDPHAVIPNRAKDYYKRPAGFRAGPPLRRYVGAHGAFSTVVDLLCWNACLTARKRRPITEFLQACRTEGTLDDGTPIGYAYGVHVRNVDGIRVVFHAGRHGAYRHAYFSVAEEDLAVVVLSNVDTFPAMRIGRTLTMSCLGRPFGWTREQRGNQPGGRSAPPPEKIPIRYHEYDGVYQSTELPGPLRIDLAEGQLVVGGHCLSPSGPDRFGWRDLVVQFTRNRTSVAGCVVSTHYARGVVCRRQC